MRHSAARKKTVFLFPGQGAVPESPLVDFVGTSIEEQYNLLRGEASPPLSMFEQGNIDSDRSAQLGVFGLSLAMGREAMHHCTPDMITGYSSGLYAAMAASGGLTPDQGNQAIELAYAGICQSDMNTVMVGIIGLKVERVATLLQEQQPQGALSLVNNKSQTIVSIAKERFSAFQRDCLGAGALKIIPLPFTYPYHVPALAKTSQNLMAYFDSLTMPPLEIPMVAGSSPEYVDIDSSRIGMLVASQLSQTVYWHDTIHALIGLGAETFVVFDPTGTLTRIIRWISRQITVIPIETPADIRCLRDLR
ncbi:MAG: hypothetical protein PF442_07250 [Desulfobulbaceae bacterium]|jgi:[acyl-carrier-protein] S-malonyltransferase|nr:hypothetical protein [Desulfobulbaceae bacterium]